MDNKKMLILGGGAAFFAALGYLGLQFVDEDEENVVSDSNPELVFTKMNKINMKDEDSENNLTQSSEDNDVVKEVKDELNNQKLYNSIEKEDDEKSESDWGKWWRNEYSNVKDDKNKEVQVSDFN